MNASPRTSIARHAAIVGGAASVLAVAGAASAQTADLTPSNDTYIRFDVGFGETGVSTVLDSRHVDPDFEFTPYIQFDMSSLNIDEITGATLTLTKTTGPSGRNDTIVPSRFGAYGLTNQEGNTPQDWDETLPFAGDVDNEPPEGLDFRNVGAEWNDVEFQNTDPAAPQNFGLDRDRLFNLDAEFGASVTETVVGGDGSIDTPVTLEGPDLVTFLNQRADDNGLVTFIIGFTQTANRGFGFFSKEAEDPSVRPMLSLEFSSSAPALAADFNGDSAVDLADLTILGNGFGLADGASLIDGDANGDGAVDLADLTILGNEFGESAGGTSLAAVPEPGTLALLSLGGLAMLRRRGR